jgi:hypothetical protein
VVDAANEPAPVPPPTALAALPPVPRAIPAEPAEDTALLSDEAGLSISQSFHALTHAYLAKNMPPLDETIRDMLRPMLKSWLDDNLPSIVERLVRAEIERVARGGRS